MCLTIDKEKFKMEIAQEDIVVYKVLEKYRELTISPYQGFEYEIGKEYKTRMEPYFDCTYYKIKEGFYSFLNEEDAKSEKIWIEDYCIGNWNLCCFRCIIPKGTNVVYGKYCKKDVIVSEAIKVIEEVKS